METIYLRNGQKCLLHEELPNGKFLIEEYFYYNGYDDENDFESLSGEQKVVHEIFKDAPVAVLDKEYSEKENLLDHLNTNIANLRSEEYALKFSVMNLSKTKIDKEKFIIDRSAFLSAKEIVAFIGGSIMPKRTSDSKYGFKITISIEMRNGEERGWYYTLYDDKGRYDYSDHIDPKQPLLFDPTEEEVDSIICSRILSVGDDFSKLRDVPEKYLTEKHKKGISDLKKKEVEKQILNLDNEIEKLNSRKQSLLSGSPINTK